MLLRQGQLTTPPAPYALQITPATLTMQVGDTRQFSAVDNHGYPRMDVIWSVSDPTIATLAPDGSPTLTAVASGQVTLTANAEGTTAQETITVVSTRALAAGAATWSASRMAGFSLLQLSQAMPTGVRSRFVLHSNQRRRLPRHGVGSNRGWTAGCGRQSCPISTTPVFRTATAV